MITKQTSCSKCGKQLEYWTLKNFIECTGCREFIEVKPCEEEVVEEIDEVVNEEEEL